MKCKNLIAMCAKTHQPCPYVSVNGKCQMSECENASIPTFKDMFDIYCSVKTSNSIRTIQNIKSIMQRLPQLVGQTFESKVVLGDNEWELIYARLKNGTHPFAKEGGYDFTTIDTMFNAFRACAGAGDRRMRLEYRRRGLSQPDCDLIPDTREARKAKHIETLSKEQLIKLRDKMAILAASKKVNDYNFLMRLFFGWYLGMRPSDVHWLKWDCIVKDENGGYRIEYVPRKTERTSGGRKLGFPFHPTLYTMIKPFIRRYGEYVMVRHDNMNTCEKHGRYSRLFSSLERRINAFFRNDLGTKGNKASYLMRRDCSKYTLEHEGPLAEMQKLGHRLPITFKNYADISSLDLKGKFL